MTEHGVLGRMKVLTIRIAFATRHLCCCRWTSCDIFPIWEIVFLTMCFTHLKNPQKHVFEVLDLSSLKRNLMLKLGCYSASLGCNFTLGEKKWNSCSNCHSLGKYRIKKSERWWQQITQCCRKIWRKNQRWAVRKISYLQEVLFFVFHYAQYIDHKKTGKFTLSFNCVPTVKENWCYKVGE